MTPDPQKPNDDDLQPVLRRFGEEFGPRQEREPEPIYGEARPIPQQSHRLSLPLGQPRAVWVLLALNIVIFVIPALLDLLGRTVVGSLLINQQGACINNGSQVIYSITDYIFVLGAKVNCRIANNNEFYRLITSMFLHLGILHIGVNAYSLYAIGPETERLYGTARFLAIYFIAGLAGGIASYAFSPYPGVGASGAIFGLVGALAVFYYTSRALLGEIARRQLGSLITVIMINLFIGFSANGVIDNFAHMGGLAGGAVLGWLLAPRFTVDERIYPPQVVRRPLPWGWAATIGVLALLVCMIIVINPPIQ